MLTVIAILFGGILCGYLLRKLKPLERIGKPIFVAVLVLLFLMGLAVGGNPSIVDNLSRLGGQALILAVAGTLGSVLGAFAVYRLFFRKDPDHER